MIQKSRIVSFEEKLGRLPLLLRLFLFPILILMYIVFLLYSAVIAVFAPASHSFAFMFAPGEKGTYRQSFSAHVEWKRKIRIMTIIGILFGIAAFIGVNIFTAVVVPAQTAR